LGESHVSHWDVPDGGIPGVLAPQSMIGIVALKMVMTRIGVRLVVLIAIGATIAYGMVIDFTSVGIGSVRTGIFNVADMAIMLGAGIFVLEGCHQIGMHRRKALAN
jgi:lipoprotein signal peptidase